MTDCLKEIPLPANFLIFLRFLFISNLSNYETDSISHKMPNACHVISRHVRAFKFLLRAYPRWHSCLYLNAFAVNLKCHLLKPIKSLSCHHIAGSIFLPFSNVRYTPKVGSHLATNLCGRQH